MSVLALRPGPAGSGTPGPGAGWQSLTRIQRHWVALAFAGCALYAGGVALFTTNDLHRLWGTAAAVGYLVAAIVTLAWRSRGLDLALLSGLCGALLVPLGWLAVQGRQQPEVSVIIKSAQLLVHDGTPYQSTAALAAAHHPYAYDPYLPVMTLFGLPRALASTPVLTDPRIWFGVAFVLAFGLALAAAGAQDWIRWTAFVTASPVIAFELAVGGTDIPVLALMCLGLALLWRTARHEPHPVLAGLVLGVDAAMKATAWPALVIAIVLLAVRDGRRATVQFAVAAAAACAVLRSPLAGRPGGQHDRVPARADEEHVARGQPAARAPAGADRAHGSSHRRRAAPAGRRRRSRVAGARAAEGRARRDLAADRRLDADVHARPGHQVRLLHLPRRAAGLAAHRPRRPVPCLTRAGRAGRHGGHLVGRHQPTPLAVAGGLWPWPGAWPWPSQVPLDGLSGPVKAPESLQMFALALIPP